MPVLNCARREKFAQGVASGLSQAEAYRQANKNSLKWKLETVCSRASEWMADGNISGRVADLKAESAKQVGITVADLIAELEQARVIAIMATPSPQSSAAVAATLGKAKLLGLDKQMVELTGKDGGPLSVQSHDLSALNKAELKALQALLAKAGAVSE